MISSVVDTVVLRYFLLVAAEDLLFDLLGRPVGVPRIVYDPDEEIGDELAMSEIRRSIFVQQRNADDVTRSTPERDRARDAALALGRAQIAFDDGRIAIIDMTDPERAVFSALTNRARAAEHGLRFALQAGEAACVAIAIERNLPLVTDDGDALKALEFLEPGHDYERIRKLLRRAVRDKRITKLQANALHQRMIDLGFRDRDRPFPKA